MLQALPIGQRQRGHRVRVALVVRAAEERDGFVAPLLAAGVEVDVLRLPARAYLQERRLIRELCARFRPDVVHTHGYRPDVLDAGIARSMGSTWSRTAGTGVLPPGIDPWRVRRWEPRWTGFSSVGWDG